MKTRIIPISSIGVNHDQRKPVRFDSANENKRSRRKRRGIYALECCCTSTNGLTTFGLALAIIGILFLVAITAIIPLIIILKFNTELSNNSTSLIVNVPKRLGIYYGWPSLVHGANWNLTAAIITFSQFDLIVFGDGISAKSHGDHVNTQTIIQSLNNIGKLTFGYIDLGVITQNLSILQMQTTVDEWAAMGIQGIFWDDAGYDYGVTRSRQNTMISYCHALNLRVMLNAWDPDDVMSGSPMLLDSRDIYLLESYLISSSTYRDLTAWKIKADKCLSYSNLYGISMATVSTSSTPISSSFGSTQQFSQAWFGTAIYNFHYFQVTDIRHSAGDNILYAFEYPISSYGNTWQTNDIQNDSSIHYYRSTDTYTLHIYGDGATYGSGNFSLLSNG
ncbi:unnamed protein product [Rotaria sordida]|uniref:Uncharacterized protein n=1 Tax=Rotaria sordida TaxID=392033 RepID=A0A819FXN6_9BILA|nr:unnamed protein product [Rotaria sordida]CAF3876250.1 unnamed protein product [Rotaria sordida]